MKTLFAILALVTILNSAETVTIAELGQADVDTIRNAEDAFDKAQARVKEAQAELEARESAWINAQSNIRRKYGDTIEADSKTCTAGEKHRTVTVEIRGKYAVISDGDRECYGQSLHSFGGTSNGFIY